jgi:hypothetical protein
METNGTGQNPKSFEDCGKQLRAEGFNHVDGNRWGKLERGRVVFARVVATQSGFAIELPKPKHRPVA